jgi:serine/threonine-protein kinase
MFLQQRLALYGQTTAALSGLFLVVGVIANLAVGRNWLEDPGRLPHLAGTSLAIALWLAGRRRRPHSLLVLNWLDAGATVSMAAMFALMAHRLLPGVGTLVGTLAVSYITLGRSAQVPSTPQRTLKLTGISQALVLLSALLGPVPPGYPEVGGRVFATLDPMLWCIAGTALATVISKVIYGLQEKVLEARQLGQYTLEAKIGEGGMGEIYRARHAMLRRPTAIKLLPGNHSEDQLRRFEREVQLTASLSHPNTICVFDYGRTPEGTFYYAMELLDGLNLQVLIDRYGAQPPGRVVNILMQACGALSEAHEVGLIHRDLKPANIHLCRQGGIDDFVKVLDFGLVRHVDRSHSVMQSSAQLLVGTPMYMAPESIVDPERIDTRADLYSLGVTAYHLLVGSPPFDGHSVVELCGHHLHTVPVPPSRRIEKPIPEALERIVMACLAKRPEERPRSAKQLAGELAGATGIATFSSDDARHWWENEFETRAMSLKPSSGQRTIQVDLDQRVAGNSRTLPKTA